jgi:hypothetical protein
VVSGGVLVFTMASPVDSDDLPRVWGARVAGPPPRPATLPAGMIFDVGSGAGRAVLHLETRA